MYETYIPSEMFLSEDGCYRPWCPIEDEYVAGEIVNRWFHREQARRLKDIHESEMLKFDAELAELLFRRKLMLSQLGRNGRWSHWLREQGISRSTADRLVAQHASSHGLSDELRHRDIAEPLQGDVCLAAKRVFNRLKNKLSTPRSRLMFLRALAYRFGLEVDLGENGSVHFSLSPPRDENELSDRVPNVIEVLDDGTIAPVNYELKEEGR